MCQGSNMATSVLQLRYSNISSLNKLYNVQLVYNPPSPFSPPTFSIIAVGKVKREGTTRETFLFCFNIRKCNRKKHCGNLPTSLAVPGVSKYILITQNAAH